jgi:hypothetical protein
LSGILVRGVGERIPERLGSFLRAQHSPRGRASVGTGGQVFGAQQIAIRVKDAKDAVLDATVALAARNGVMSKRAGAAEAS